MEYLVDRPDVGPMRRLESYPQAGVSGDSPESHMAFRRVLITSFFGLVDGLVLMATPELEPESTAYLPKLVGIPLYSLGFAPSQCQIGETEEIPQVMNNPNYPTDDGRCKRFLDDCFSKHGPKSVIYVRSVSFRLPLVLYSV